MYVYKIVSFTAASARCESRVGWSGQMSDVDPVSPVSQTADNAELYGGIALGIATLAVLIVANSPLGPQYRALFDTTAEIRIGSVGLSKSLEHWINDGLMAIFFLLVGLEIKREVIEQRRLGGSGGHRHRLCNRHLRIARPRRSRIAEDVPAGAGHHR